MPADKLKTQFMRLYSDVCERIMGGEEFTMPSKMQKLEDKSNVINLPINKTEAGREYSKKICEQAKKTVNILRRK